MGRTPVSRTSRRSRSDSSLFDGRRRLRSRYLVAAIAATALAAVAAGLPSVPAAAASPQSVKAATPRVGPEGDAFYQPPSPLPAGKPGDVIWYRKVNVPGLLGIVSVSLSNAYKVLYRSTDTHGKPIAVSGIVLVPLFKNPATVPIVGYAPGTQGIGDTCAPSKLMEQGLAYDSLYVNALVNRGFAVALTDYEGLGTPGDHTYVIGRSEGHAVNDAVRAATRLSATGLSRNAKVAFSGYSQGGGGATWAAELQPSYAPELKLVGVAAGGIPADLMAVSKQLDGGLGFGFLAAAAIGLDAAYPELNLDSYLNDTGRTEINAGRTACVADLVLKYPFKKMSQYTTRDPLTSPDWIARINEQKLGKNPPRVPMFQWHALTDELVVFEQADALHKTYCKAGVNLSWHVHIGEHATAMISGTPAAEQWIADRFAGKKATSNC